MGGDTKGNWASELKATLWLAGPIVLGNLGQILIGVVDTLMIGQVGVAPLGAAAFVNNIFVIPLVALMGVLASVTVLVSQSKGAGDRRQVGRHIRHGLAMTVVVSLVAMGLLGANALFLDRYGQESVVVEAARGYYWLVVLSLLPALFYHCMKSVWEGLGWSQAPMVVLLGGIGLNVLLNWLLIFGALGFPELGLLGAGWATLISRCLVAAVMFALTLRAKRFEGLLPRRWLSGYEWPEFRGMLKLGLPMGAQHLFEVGAFAGAGIMVGWLGKEALAAHQIAMSCAAMSFMIPLGVSIACGIRVGAAMGGGDWVGMQRIYATTFWFTLLQTIGSAAVFLVGGEWLARQFVDSETVIAAAAAIFVVVGLFQIFDGAQVACLGALRGMSDVTIPMWITFGTYWVVALPAGYVFGFVLGYDAVGVWSGLALGLLLAAVLLWGRLRFRFREAR
ncbi:MATE family efflux transporter [Pelagicoccus sp. SDUM812005]|uniref:MATE family efflux transporter n=1 Tax=Pelagicoccus sp. SDUM812005 TaxID=3041257 RepID=UPI00280C66E9|nr:MATE family efflux transporter [Pelagicoccus sp. SDUM812005]MDQ8182406.1 MATE family efflux transporter [Pelagicoccus sp. SDUM812005]